MFGSNWHNPYSGKPQPYNAQFLSNSQETGETLGGRSDGIKNSIELTNANSCFITYRVISKKFFKFCFKL